MPSAFKRSSTYIATALIITAGVFLVGHNTWAADTTGGWAATVVIWLSQAALWALNMILVLAIQALLFVASIQEFTDSQAVILGWVIVRDICNMFFVVVLMMIAFGTILNIPDYSYKKWLPKLVLFAVLINFSKTICGLLIDVAQVVMLTFVNAFKDIGGANLINMLGITDIVTLNDAAGGSNDWAVAGAYVLGVIYLLIALVVISTMVMILVMRLIMLWIYIVLSPAAYLLAAVPGGQKYSSQWWDEFIKNLIVGPVLAFFIWLSLAALGTSSVTGLSDATGNAQSQKDMGALIGQGTASSAATKGATSSHLIKFVIAIGMLVGGLMVSQQIGGAAGSLAGKGMAKIQKGAAFAGGLASGAGLMALKGAKGGSGYLGRKFAKVTGVDLRPSKIKESIKASLETNRKKDETEIKEKAKHHFEAGGLRSVALGMGVGEDYFNRHIDGFMNYKGIGRAVKETFYSPGKRRSLSEQVDKNSAEKSALQDQKAEHAKTLQPEIRKLTAQRLSGNKEYKSYITSASDRLEMDALNEKAKKGPLTKAEQDRKMELQKKMDEQGQKRKEIEQKVGKEATDYVLKKDKGMIDINAKITVNEGELKKLKEEINHVQAPVAFEARSHYRRGVEEAKSKYKTITNADELIRALVDAKQREDKFDQIAIMEKLSGDANLNEVLNNSGYSANAKGLHAYVFNHENDFGEKKGLTNFNDKERLQIQNDLGEIEERVGHWEMAKMAGMNDKGEMESTVQMLKNPDGSPRRADDGRIMYNDMAHAIASYAEIIKMDPQKIVNSLNRLAIGGENGKGQFELANLGKMLFKNLAAGGVWEKQKDRILGNTAANLSDPNVIKLLERIMEYDKETGKRAIDAIKARGQMKGVESGGMKPGDMARSIKAGGLAPEWE